MFLFGFLRDLKYKDAPINKTAMPRMISATMALLENMEPREKDGGLYVGH